MLLRASVFQPFSVARCCAALSTSGGSRVASASEGDYDVDPVANSRQSKYPVAVRKWVFKIAGFNQYGLYHDDVLNETPEVIEAIRRLPPRLQVSLGEVLVVTPRNRYPFSQRKCYQRGFLEIYFNKVFVAHPVLATSFLV